MTTTTISRHRIAGALAAAVLLSPFALTGVALAEGATDAPAATAAAEPAPETTSADAGPAEQSVAVEQAPVEQQLVTTTESQTTATTTSNGATGSCPGGQFCETPSTGDNQGNGNAPENGSVGNADNMNPPGQVGKTTDSGYECAPNSGVGDNGGNPAHTGCASTVIPVGGNGIAAIALAAVSVPALGLALFVARRRNSSADLAV